MKNFSIIAAADQNYGIGINNRLPWNIPSELKYFQEVTHGSTVIMGRKTWDSLPSNSKPLPNRQNIVISRSADLELPEKVLLASSLGHALEKAVNQKVFVIGGAQLYAESIKHPKCTQVYLTKIQDSFECDTFFPGEDLEKNYLIQSESDLIQENGVKYKYFVYFKN